MRRHLAFTALLLALAPATRAEDACTATVQRLCPASRGDRSLSSCFRAHEQEIARACPGDLQAVVARARQIGEPCEPDAVKLCRDVPAGRGRVAACLRDHESELSQSCQSAFNDWRLAQMRLTSACAGDVGRLCPNLPQGGGRIWTCLKEHEKDLSSDCRDAVKKL